MTNSFKWTCRNKNWNEFSIPDKRKKMKEELLSGKEKSFKLLISDKVRLKEFTIWYLPLKIAVFVSIFYIYYPVK